MDHVDWLDDTELRIWLAFLEATARVTGALDASIKRRTGLRFEDYEVLVHLSESDDRRLRMTELSERLLHSQARVTQRVTRLRRSPTPGSRIARRSPSSSCPSRGSASRCASAT